MSFLKEIGSVIGYFRAAKISPDITIYSENAIYMQYYKGTIDYIKAHSDLKILYITSDHMDSVLNEYDGRIDSFYIKKLLPFIFPLISTKILLLTMVDLNQYHIKRSTNSVNHIYVFHAINSTHMIYNEGAFNHYDTIFCVGPHQVEEIRKTEEIYHLPEKELIFVGYSWLEDLEFSYRQRLNANSKDKPRKILIAPSWSSGNILETCIDTLLGKLIPLEYEIILRPHPEYIKRFGDVTDEIIRRYEKYENFLFETDLSSSGNIMDASILITDWSGIGFEFAWGMGKPVVYIDTPKKIHNANYKKLNLTPLEVRVRDQIGSVIDVDDAAIIDKIVAKALMTNKKNMSRIVKLRNENIFNWGLSSEIAGDYIIKYCKNLE
jgi:YidC/Oxa1 family membrane protein insertase